MDLVKIGFQINANGLKDANTEVDKLLNRVDKIGSGSKKNASDFENSQKRVKDSSKSTTNEIDKTTKALERQRLIGEYLGQGLDKTTASTIASFRQLGGTTSQVNSLMQSLASNKALVQAQKDAANLASSQNKTKDSVKKTGEEVDKTTKALERQRLIGEYLGKGLDKTTASAIANFKQLGGTTSQVNALMTSLANNKGIVQAQKDAANLARNQAKAAEDLETARQKRFAAVQNEYLKNMELIKSEAAARKAAAQKVIDDAEAARQKRFAAAQKYYQQQMELLAKETAARKSQQQQTIDDAEAARQKRFAAAQKYYQQQMELLAKETAAKKTQQQKILDDAEAARQKKFAAVQNEYQKQQQAIVDARQKAIDGQVKAQNTLNESNQKAIALEQAKAKYVSQGFGKTDSTRLARLEVSGADITTLNNYKDAIRATTRATQALNPVVQEATVRHNNFLGQIKGIAAYALLSTAIYGAMTATLNMIAATIKMADEYTSIQNRMKLYITDAQELTDVNAKLAQFSVANNVGLRETATLFTRLTPAMQKIGANTTAVTSVVDAFGKSLRIGGATAMEAASATIQFSQAMASGKLAGDEFRSISEASPRFLKAIAEGSGIAADQLKKMSAAGMLTTEVISKALLNEYPKLIEENKKLGVTLEQGANALKTGFLVAFGEFNEGAGITEALGESMANLAQNMFTAAQGARQFGADVNKWFKDNADTIQTVVDAFQLLAITVVSKYVASMVVAGAISLKTAYILNVASLGATAVQRAFGLAAIAAIRLGVALEALATPKNLFTLGLTVAAVAASYLLMRDNAAEATQKLVEQSEYVDITTEAYQKLNKEQQLNARSSVVNDMNEVNKKLDEQAAAVENVLKSYAMSRQFSGLGLDKGTKEIINGVTKGVLSYDTALRMLSENSNVPKRIVEAFKKEKDIYNETAKSAVKFADAAKVVGVDSEISGNKMQNAAIQALLLGNGYSDVGDKAEIAGGKVRKFYQDLQADTQKNILAFDLKNKLNVSPSTANKVADELYNRAAQEEGLKNKELINQQQKLVKLKTDLIAQIDRFQKGAKSTAEVDQLKANTAEVLKQERIYDNMRKSKPYVKVNPSSLITPEETKIIKAYDASTSLSSNQTKADKEASKIKRDSDKDLKKFQNQVTEMETYYDVLKRVNNLDVARIASQKEYINIYKDNLAVATELANIQEMTRKEENRQEYNKSLRDQVEQLSVIAGLTEAGADYETAKALAAAGFVNDAKGRAAAEKTIMNTLTGQSFALSDQINDQETLNQYLKEGLGIEEARFKVALSRIAKLSGGKNVFGEFGEDFENSMKSLRVKRATEASQLKINSLNREAALLTTSMAFSYTAASLAAAKLSASTQGLLYSQAETQLTKQNEVDLIAEQYEVSLKISSLLSQDSEVMRDIKSQYPTILEADAQRLETARKLLEITEAYSAKQQEQKKNPLGDFSNVDFDVFGDIGNPFKEALDGLSALVGGMTSLDEKIKVVRESTRQYQVESELASLSGQTDKAKAMMDLANKQLDLEKDLQKQKAETIDIAYGQGLKFAKSFFKENSKGHKVVSALEMALQAKKIAFALWEKKDTIAKYALELKGMLANAARFVSTTATKIAAQMGFNVAQAQGAVAASANAPPPFGFASAAAMIALLAGIGIAISGGGSSGSFAPTNTGTGTVFGDSEAQSASIANSIDLLSENSDLMLPLTSAMLRSLRNIESNIGGVTNLVIRNAVGSKLGDGVNQGFSPNLLGKVTSNSTGGVLGGLLGGGALGATFGVSTIMSGLGIGAMGALAIAGPIGLAIGAILGPTLGKALGGLFGTKTTIKGQGLYGGSQDLGSILSQGFNLQEYVDVNTKKKTLGITTSNKNKTVYDDANEELANQFTLIFSGFYDSILSATDILGADLSTVQTNLENAVVDIGKIDLKGLDADEIQEKLEAVFGAAADSLAQQGFAGLDDFQTVGEGYYETLIKVATGVEQATYFTDRLNVTAIAYTQILNKQGDVAAEIVRQSVLLTDKTKGIAGGLYELVNNFEGTAEELTDFVLTLRDLQDQLFMTGKNANYLTSAMILGAGGLDKLSSGFDAYFEMLSPAEQAAELTRRLTNEFAVFGKELPSDVKAFRNLVSGIDISTEAGQKLYGQILALAPEFNDLQDALESTNSEVNALVQSLRDLAEQARVARGETEQPRNLAFLRNEFESASILAMQGDTEAANRLLTLGKDLMQVSKLYALSGSEYAKDLALIQRAATVSADVQENGLGTSISPTLTPSNATNIAPTVETTNTSTDTKLEAIREEFNAGLFAIAKYTQDMASRFERWDDGSRMLVGVQPENGDIPVPVTVVP